MWQIRGQGLSKALCERSNISARSNTSHLDLFYVSFLLCPSRGEGAIILGNHFAVFWGLLIVNPCSNPLMIALHGSSQTLKVQARLKPYKHRASKDRTCLHFAEPVQESSGWSSSGKHGQEDSRKFRQVIFQEKTRAKNFGRNYDKLGRDFEIFKHISILHVLLKWKGLGQHNTKYTTNQSQQIPEFWSFCLCANLIAMARRRIYRALLAFLVGPPLASTQT